MRAMMRALVILISLIASPLSASAMVGGAGAASPEIARAIVLIVGSRGNFCSGVALARDLVLTAAHCVLPGADYKIVEFDSARQPLLRDIYCSPVYYSQTLQPVPDPFASLYVPCQQVEEWLYERGPGQLPAVVRFRAGVVQSIRYGRDPQ